VIPKLTPAGFTVPVAKDNSNGIKTFSVDPANFDPSVVLKADLTVTYSAVDFNNNNADDCKIKIRIKGWFIVSYSSVVKEHNVSAYKRILIN